MPQASSLAMGGGSRKRIPQAPMFLRGWCRAMKLASAFNGSSSLVTLTRLADDRYVDVNDSFARAVGYGREELLGRTPAETGVWDPEARAELLQRLGREGSVADLPVAYRSRDGSRHPGVV